MSGTYLRGTEQRSCVMSIILGPSANFLHLRSKNIFSPKKKLQHADKLERKRHDILATCEKIINIVIGYNWAAQASRKVTKRY